MKVIFLDIDGVLNTSKTFIDIYNEYQKTGHKRLEIDLFRLEFLKSIVDSTGAVIVLSSSWRFYGQMKNGQFIPLNDKMAKFIELLKKYDLYIYDITPKDELGIRQNEIAAWLKYKDVESFIIIDDDSYDLTKYLSHELIKTSTTSDYEMLKNMDNCTGLCEYHIPLAINKLTLKKLK